MRSVNETPDQIADDDDATILVDRPLQDDDATVLAERPSRNKLTVPLTAPENRRRAGANYVLLPLIFLTVTLLGGLRLSTPDNAFIFLVPPLFCLIFATILLALFFQARIVQLDGWFSERASTAQNAANGWILFTLFAASAQMFNSVLPEQGLPFWVVGFCFFWTLWNNLFAEFDARRLVRSLGGLFGLAFVVKYLVLANLSAPDGGSWLSRMIQNPTKEAFTWALDIPRFAAGTGYIQFFTAVLYFIGLMLLPAVPKRDDEPH